MKTIKEIKQDCKRQIAQVKKDEAYSKNFYELIKNRDIEKVFNLKDIKFYTAESIFKYQTVKFNIDTFENALCFFNSLEQFTIELFKINNYGSIYPKTELKESKTAEFKIKENYYLKVEKCQNYPHNEIFCFYIQFNNKVYNIQINIENKNYYYSFKYAGKTERSKIISSNIICKDLDFAFEERIKLWSPNNINDFLLFNK